MAPKEDSTAITFTEVDEVNHPTATYIYSEPAAGPAHREHGKKHGENWGRVDVAVSDDQCYPNPRTRLQSCRSNLTNCAASMLPPLLRQLGLQRAFKTF